MATTRYQESTDPDSDDGVEALVEEEGAAAHVAEEEEEKVVENAEDGSMSALRENIARKGANSYYHAHSRPVNGPQWDGNPEPRLLHTGRAGDGEVESKQQGEVEVAAPVAVSASATPSMQRKERITTYSWLDEGQKVRVYVPLDGIGDLPEENIALDWTPKSLKLDIRDYNGRDHALHVHDLYEHVKGVTMRVKANKITLTLRKVGDQPITWSQLHRAPAGSGS